MTRKQTASFLFLFFIKEEKYFLTQQNRVSQEGKNTYIRTVSHAENSNTFSYDPTLCVLEER
jgi:hypothetical protein